MGMLFISRLSCDLQAVSGGLSYSVWDFSTQLCVKWVPCCMVNPVPSCHVGSAAHLACGWADTGTSWQHRAGCVCRMAPWQLPGSGSPEWSCAQLIQHFSKAADCLHALSVDMPEFSRHTAAWAERAALQHWLSCAGLEILGKCRSPQAVLLKAWAWGNQADNEDVWLQWQIMKWFICL